VVGINFRGIVGEFILVNGRRGNKEEKEAPDVYYISLKVNCMCLDLEGIKVHSGRGCDREWGRAIKRGGPAEKGGRKSNPMDHLEEL